MAERGAIGATRGDVDTQVDVSTGMIAAGRLQALMESRTPSMLDMWVQMNRIMDAIESTVPEELWPEILRKVDGDDASQRGGRHQRTFEPHDNRDDADDFD
jgi:hypothetical protein